MSDSDINDKGFEKIETYRTPDGREEFYILEHFALFKGERRISAENTKAAVQRMEKWGIEPATSPFTQARCGSHLNSFCLYLKVKGSRFIFFKTDFEEKTELVRGKIGKIHKYPLRKGKVPGFQSQGDDGWKYNFQPAHQNPLKEPPFSQAETFEETIT